MNCIENGHAVLFEITSRHEHRGQAGVRVQPVPRVASGAAQILGDSRSCHRSIRQHDSVELISIHQVDERVAQHGLLPERREEQRVTIERADRCDLRQGGAHHVRTFGKHLIQRANRCPGRQRRQVVLMSDAGFIGGAACRGLRGRQVDARERGIDHDRPGLP